MTLFLIYYGASLLGTLTGGVGLMYLAGYLAKRAETKRRQEFESIARKQLEELNKRMEREKQRMKKYAELEG